MIPTQNNWSEQLLERKQSITKEIEKLKTQLTAIDVLLGAELAVAFPITIKFTDYSKDANWNDKVAYVLGQSDKPLGNGEIVERIMKLEGTDDIVKIRRAVSPVLSRNDKGQFEKTETNGKNEYSIKK